MTIDLDLILKEVKKEYNEYLDSFATVIETIEIANENIEDIKDVETTSTGEKVVYKKRMTNQRLGGFYVNQYFAYTLKNAKKWEYEYYNKETKSYFEYIEEGERFDIYSYGKYSFSITLNYAENLIEKYIYEEY